MTVLAIGDIGLVSGMMHIGDEAMFEAARDELAERGLSMTGISAEPTESSARYGMPMVGRLGFAGLSRAEAAARADLLVAAATGRVRLEPDDPAGDVLEVFDDASGLLNAGGGNLASRWPVHVYERTALAAMARARGIPVVVSGQTFGPDLADGDAERVATMVRAAALTGVREPVSGGLARSWGASVIEGVDDASFLGWSGVAGAADASDTVIVSLSGWFDGRPADEVERRIASLADHAARTVGPVVFHAHFGPFDRADAPAGDAALHERIRARMTEPSEVAPTGDPRGAAALARGARLLITGRYHPAVFAAPAGVPIVALSADDYTRIKLSGALAHWGQGGVLDLDDLPPSAVDRVMDQGGVIAARAADRLPRLRDRAREWWDAVADALGP